VEVGLVLTVVLNTAAGRRRDWHRRWLEARDIAEHCRAGLPLWLLGATVVAAASGEHSFTGWYVRAHFRALGLSGGPLDAGRCGTIRSTLLALIEDQCSYHSRRARGLKVLERAIEWTGTTLLCLTLAVSIAYLTGVALGTPTSEWWSYLVTTVTTGLPAF